MVAYFRLPTVAPGDEFEPSGYARLRTGVLATVSPEVTTRGYSPYYKGRECSSQEEEAMSAPQEPDQSSTPAPDEPRMPDLRLDPEAAANLQALLDQPSHPSAAQDNLARAREALRARRHRRPPSDEPDEALAR